MIKEFKEFALRGNVIDLAIAVIMGAAFGPIVTSAVNDIIMPPIGLVLGQVDFKDLFLNLGGGTYASLAAAKAAAAPAPPSPPTTPTMKDCSPLPQRRAAPGHSLRALHVRFESRLTRTERDVPCP